MIKGIIFDLDGVIVSTDRFHFKAWRQLALEMGFFLEEKVGQRLRGVGRMESLEIVLEGYKGKPLSQKDKEMLADRKNIIYKQYLETMTPTDVADETRETLDELRRRGYRLAIGSSSKNAGFILDRVALTQAFDAVSDGRNITRSKPDPEVFLKAAESLSLHPWECIVVEDAFAGIDAAKAGGMKAVGIGEASRYEKADYRIRKLKELLDICHLRGHIIG